MAIKLTALSLGTLLSLSLAQEQIQDSKLHLTEISCKAFAEFAHEEQAVIVSWLQAYLLPEHAPAVIDLEKLSSDRAKLTEYCINRPQEEVMTAAEAVMGQEEN